MGSMKQWLQRFYKNQNEKITLTLNGNLFERASCRQLGKGSQKTIYKIKDSNQCFFIPNKWSTENNWDNLIECEKELLDQLIDLGLKAQQFEIVPLEINEPGLPPYTIKVLLTKDFESLCQEESITIYNYKGDQKVIGASPNFNKMKFDDKEFIQKMFKKIINEYALAFTFSLPISILQSLDDSEHYCFELTHDNENEPPVARYIFWDVAGDFSGKELPQVPTLDDLKRGTRGNPNKIFSRHSTDGLNLLANGVACALHEMCQEQINVDGFTFVRETQKAMLVALNEDDFLNPALEHARREGIKFFNEIILPQFEKEKITPIPRESLVLLLQSAISLETPALIIQILSSSSSKLTNEDVNKIMDVAKKYNNPLIIEFLTTNLHSESEKLKTQFLTKYSSKLTSDKQAWGGLYSFFAKSYVTPEMSLQQLVHHAQGLSKEGSGKRSKKIMKEMGWLNENNQLSPELSSVFTLK